MSKAMQVNGSTTLRTVQRYQIYNIATGAAEGVPYRYIGRCLMRVRELNIFEKANRFSLKPVRTPE